jgi:hypothetical protein
MRGFTRSLYNSLLCVFLLLAVSSAAAETQVQRDCRADGWDPTQLACATCDLLPTDNTPLQTRCRACCQDVRDTAYTVKPYQAAVLVVPAQLPEEVQKLVDDDWEALVAAKGGTARLRKMGGSRSSGGQSYFFAAPPVYVYFFNDAATAATATSEALAAALAQESMALTGWKREDMRDMLQTLLP